MANQASIIKDHPAGTNCYLGIEITRFSRKTSGCITKFLGWCAVVDFL